MSSAKATPASPETPSPETPTPQSRAQPPAEKKSAETRTRVRAAVEAALDRKAEDVRVLELAEASDFTDFFVICSGNSERQVQAVAEAIERSLRDFGEKPLHLEGMTQGHWVLMDYSDLVVHVFEVEKRDFYRLERLWADAPDRTSEFVSSPPESPAGSSA